MASPLNTEYTNAPARVRGVFVGVKGFRGESPLPVDGSVVVAPVQPEGITRRLMST